MKLVALPAGKQRKIVGPAINVPSKVDRICEILPRLPADSEMVFLKLKHKVSYTGHYIHGHVGPQKLRLANQHNFEIHDVPRDGNCLYSSVLHNLTSLGISNVSVNFVN